MHLGGHVGAQQLGSPSYFLHSAEQYLNQKTNDIEELKDIVQKLKAENEVYEAKAARLKNKAKQIAEE